MTFQESVKHVFNNYANFSGRASRSEYWYFFLFNCIIGFVLQGLAVIFGSTENPSLLFTILYYLYSLAVLIPGLAVNFRRLHDIGKGGGWILINLIPIIGSIWYIVLLCTASEPGANRFGDEPAA